MIAVHALLVLLAFTLAAVVTYAVVLGVLTLAERRWHADDLDADLADLANRAERRPRAHC